MLTHRLEANTWVLRQSLRTTFEAPFVHLLLGDDRALLLDSGATPDGSLRLVVDELVDEWLSENPRPSYALVVAHTHAHGDHVAGDAWFGDRPATTVVGHEVADVRDFFGLDPWPEGQATFDLGGRELVVAAVPGHQDAHLAWVDRRTGILYSGDTVYPGRLYVRDDRAFAASLERMVALADAYDVRHVLGAHVEMSTTPDHDFPLGSLRHDDEAPLAMSVDDLRRVADAARAAVGRPGVHRHGEFAVWNGPCRLAVARQVARTIGRRLVRRG